MSGIEIAGLALGAFPLILEVLKGLISGVDGYCHFRNIRHQLSLWIHRVEAQSVRFKRNFELLLLRSNIEEYGPRLAALIDNPDLKDDLWQKSENDWLLKCYLEGSYDVYVEGVNKLRVSLATVQKKLRIQDRVSIDKIADEEKSYWSRKRTELRLLLSSTRIDEELGNIERLNYNLREITQDIHGLHTLRPDLRTVNLRTEMCEVQTIRKYYVSLLESLKDRNLFACDCQSDHFASLRLEPKPILIERKQTGHSLYDNPYYNFRMMLVSMSAKDNENTEVRLQQFEVRPIGYDGSRDSILFTHLPWPAEGPQIQDICADVFHSKCDDPEISIGFLADLRELSLRQRLHSISHVEELRTSSLQSLLDQGDRVPQEQALTRGDRLFLAVTLACCMLHIGETAWLKDFWSSRDILLMHSRRGFCRDLVSQEIHPYLDWSMCALTGHLDDQFDLTEEAAQIVQSKPMLALGLTLVELCLGKSLSVTRTQADEKASVVGTNIATAKRSLYEIELQEGPVYRQIVEKCLYSNFQTETFDFNKDQFWKVIYQHVIAPLVGVFDDFRGLDPLMRRPKYLWPRPVH